MQPLKATHAHEIDKASVTEAEMVSVNGESVAVADGGMHAGDFYFKPNVVYKTAPSSWFRRTFRREPMKVISTIAYGIVISCPSCGLPIMTNPLSHIITSKHPLTIDRAIACPYAQPGTDTAHAFTIKAGTIEPV